MQHDRLKCLIEVLTHDFGPAMGNLAKKMYAHLPLEEQHTQIHRIAVQLQWVEDNAPHHLTDVQSIRKIITDNKEPESPYKLRLLK